MYKHLIYDFDGTLSDTYPVATEALLEILRERGVEEDYDAAYAKLKVSFRHAIRTYTQFDYDELYPAFVARAAENAKAMQRPFAETKEILAAAVKAGKKNYIYTHSGPEVLEILAKWEIAEYVTYVLDKSHGFPLKPDPTALNFLCEKFAIDPDQALMIGDRDIDIEVGHNAGMKGVLFDPEGFYADFPTDYRVSNLLEIQKLF